MSFHLKYGQGVEVIEYLTPSDNIVVLI